MLMTSSFVLQTEIQVIKTFLRLLAEKGHKASQKKLQYCQEKVVYLGQLIAKGQRCISDNHLEAICKAPKPRTVREMIIFLGIARHSTC